MKKFTSLKFIQPAISIAVVIILVSSGTMAITYEKTEMEREGIEDDVIKLNGSIIATVYNNYLGLVSPSINLSNGQTLEFNASNTGDNTYYIDSVLKIDVEVNNSLSKQLSLVRYLRTHIFIIKHHKKLFPIGNIIKRWFIGKPWTISRINVISDKNKSIEIPLEYETTEESENASMYILCIGTPRRIFRPGLPIFAFKKINLELVYRSTYNDTTPPVTICEIVGKILE